VSELSTNLYRLLGRLRLRKEGLPLDARSDGSSDPGAQAWIVLLT